MFGVCFYRIEMVYWFIVGRDKMRIAKICYNCGNRLTSGTIKRKNIETCDVCGEEFHNVDFFTGIKLAKMSGRESDKWIEQQTGHKIPEEYAKQREEDLKKTLEEIKKYKEQRATELCIQRMDREQKKHPTNIHCPTCGSNKIEKISGASRAASVGVFGLASSKIGKTFECKSCGYKW